MYDCRSAACDNGLKGRAAVALRNFSMVIVDLDVRRVIRTFTGHAGQITDMSFSPDSRWLVSSSEDDSIKVWDLSSSR